MSNQQSPLPPIDDDFACFEADDLPPDLHERPLLSDNSLALLGSAVAVFVAAAALVLSVVALCRTLPH